MALEASGRLPITKIGAGRFVLKSAAGNYPKAVIREIRSRPDTGLVRQSPPFEVALK